jgi:hypothetical protein
MQPQYKNTPPLPLSIENVQVRAALKIMVVFKEE